MMAAGRLLRLKLLDERFLGFVRRMNGKMREIEKEGPVLMTANEIDGFISEKIGQVCAFGVGDGRFGDKIKMMTGALDRLIKAALCRVVLGVLAQMPFAEHAGGVAGFFQSLSDGDFVERQFDYIVHGAKRSAAPVEAVDCADGV